MVRNNQNWYINLSFLLGTFEETKQLVQKCHQNSTFKVHASLVDVVDVNEAHEEQNSSAADVHD